MKLNQNLAAPLLPRLAHPTWASEPEGTRPGSAGPRNCGGEARAPGQAPLAEGRPAPEAAVGARRAGAPRLSAHAGSRWHRRISGSPDLGAVLQAIRLHFVTDFWTLPPTLPRPGASSRNSPPPQDRNPFQTSDRRQEKSYIILCGQAAKEKNGGGGRYAVTFSCVLGWRKERGFLILGLEAHLLPVSSWIFCPQGSGCPAARASGTGEQSDAFVFSLK